MLDERRHVVELQSLRGLASIIVLGSHVFTYYATPRWFVEIKQIVFNGEGSVGLFFVLSGYVLAASLRSAALDWRSLAAFYTKRIFRIYPALWAASALGFVYLVMFHFKTPHPGVSPWFMDRFKADRMVPIGYAAALLGALSLLVPPAWSIFNEIVGSAMLPITSRLSFDRPRRGILLAVVFGLLATTIGPYTFYGVLLFPLHFQVGVLIAVLLARRPQLKRPGPVWLGMLAAGVAAAACARGVVKLFIPDLPQLNPVIQLVELAGAACIILAVIANPIAILRNRLMKELGDISYGVYLLHFPIMCFAGLALARLAPGARDTVTETFVLFAVTFVVTIGGAILLFRFIETPFIAIGRRLAARFAQAPRRNALGATASP